MLPPSSGEVIGETLGKGGKDKEVDKMLSRLTLSWLGTPKGHGCQEDALKEYSRTD